MDLAREGNKRALIFGAYIACVIICIGVYNFLIKTYFDACCVEKTPADYFLQISNFASYLAGGAILIFILAVSIKLIILQFKPELEDLEFHWKKSRESFLNSLFIVILIANFFLLLLVQLPKFLIGCTSCDTMDIVGMIKTWF